MKFRETTASVIRVKQWAFQHVRLALQLIPLFAIQYLSCLINMHAIYAGGSTPTPSPRVHRKQFGYGRPVMPGYSFPHKQASPVHHKSASKDSNDSASKETNFRDAIPAMCTALACVCFICNIILPGLGKKRI